MELTPEEEADKERERRKRREGRRNDSRFSFSSFPILERFTPL
jgi:hypothetical protein